MNIKSTRIPLGKNFQFDLCFTSQWVLGVVWDSKPQQELIGLILSAGRVDSTQPLNRKEETAKSRVEFYTCRNVLQLNFCVSLWYTQEQWALSRTEGWHQGQKWFQDLSRISKGIQHFRQGVHHGALPWDAAHINTWGQAFPNSACPQKDHKSHRAIPRALT